MDHGNRDVLKAARRRCLSPAETALRWFGAILLSGGAAVAQGGGAAVAQGATAAPAGSSTQSETSSPVPVAPEQRAASQTPPANPAATETSPDRPLVDEAPGEPDEAGESWQASPDAAPLAADSPPTTDSSALETQRAQVNEALTEGALDLALDAEILSLTEFHETLERASAERTVSGDEGPEAEPWLVGFALEPTEGGLLLQVAARPPATDVYRARREVVTPERLVVRSMVLLREIVRDQTSAPAPPAPPAPEAPTAPRSSGSAVLALNAALLGGYIGVSLHQASGSSDDRLLYPLTALGVGLGLGGSMLVSDEWDISITEAWYLSAGMVWPATSGVMIAASHDVKHDHLYLYGLSGAAGGITLATLAITGDTIGEGGAAIAHSGGVFGLGLGAIAEGIVEGDLEEPPLAGMGYGTGAGVLAGGLLATQIDLPPSRVLLVDLAAFLGGLTGGALATPLLLGDDVGDVERRLWFGAVATGTLAGAGIGLATTRSYPGEGNNAADKAVIGPPSLIESYSPQAGVIGVSSIGHRTAPVYGAGLTGSW